MVDMHPTISRTTMHCRTYSRSKLNAEYHQKKGNTYTTLNAFSATCQFPQNNKNLQNKRHKQLRKKFKSQNLGLCREQQN